MHCPADSGFEASKQTNKQTCEHQLSFTVFDLMGRGISPNWSDPSPAQVDDVTSMEGKLLYPLLDKLVS
jgi:hypothetical protein